MTWLTLSTIPVPKPTDYPDIVDFMLAYSVYDDVRYPVSFLDGQMGPQYASPQAYLANMIEYAEGLAHLAPPVGWDAISAAKAACAVGFAQLQQLPVNAADPATWSVFMAWVMGTGTLYGGHPPIPAPVSHPVETPARVSDGGPITIFGEPVK